eukprot:15441577-Alexandrium_andersonii.AAC.1
MCIRDRRGTPAHSPAPGAARPPLQLHAALPAGPSDPGWVQRPSVLDQHRLGPARPYGARGSKPSSGPSGPR